MNDLPLEGKIAVVTGSSSGIGRAIALELAKAGADVGITYHSGKKEGEKVAAEVRDLGRRAFCEKIEVSEAGSVVAYFKAVREELGGVDILVNNAGIDGKRAPVAELAVEDWDQVIGVNLRGSFLCTRVVLAGMLAKKSGVILNVSSVHGVIPWGRQSAYCATKAALEMMTRTLALELQDSGVRAVGLAPGAIQTAINRDVWEDPEQVKDLKKKIPMGRMGEVDEMAKIVRFLVSDEAAYITGTTLTADGGMTAYPSFADGG